MKRYVRRFEALRDFLRNYNPRIPLTRLCQRLRTNYPDLQLYLKIARAKGLIDETGVTTKGHEFIRCANFVYEALTQ
ncbi:MAG TPA: hypothetical protein VHA12_00170 [Candidatus Nanoarchaeia archaeon]|nr:hypothetical protein [Candidatus Nanoarchaeia archaeon]